MKIDEWKFASICSEAHGLLLENSRLNDVDFKLQAQSYDLAYIMSVVGEYFSHKDCGDMKSAMHSYAHAIKMWEIYKKDYR